ncbi:MAG: T9SS type A sorting domain-containing protein [Bacteroidia bacterium]|nr:T9SS type A sorting domain-containing protein [Bacteroidia bacterium]
MKRSLLAMGLLCSSLFTQAQWINQNQAFTYEGFMDAVEVVNANVAWGTTYSNATGTATKTRDFVRTIDGGNTWTVGLINATPAALRPSNLFPLSDTRAFVAMYNPTAAGGKVYRTINGGTMWTQVGNTMFTQPTSFANVVYFWDEANGIVMGDPIGNPLKYELHLTTDSGTTWTAVPPASLPTLTDPAEYGIVNLFDAVQGHFWFCTTYGDVYHTSDKGLTWTKSVTGIPANNLSGGGRQDITSIAFTDSLNGIISQINASGVITMNTNDGGTTWTSITPSGTFYGDLTGVPGSQIFVSVGSNGTVGFGSSFSLDNGLTWNDLSTGASHTCVDFVDSVTGFSGEYITAGGPGGAWKFNGSFGFINCGSSQISAGVGTFADSLVCFGDTALYSVAGAVAPTDGTVKGFAVIVSTADLMGSSTPLSNPSVVGGTGVTPFPSNPFNVSLVNDGTIFPAGDYYFTPVVIGNATGTGNITSLVLDPACTTTGASAMVRILASGDPLCNTSSLIDNAGSEVKTFFSNQTLNITINAAVSDKTAITVFDATGRVVLNKTVNTHVGANNFTLNASDLNSGIYMIKVANSSNQVTNRLFKN